MFSNYAMALELQGIVNQFPDLDKTLSGLVVVFKGQSLRSARKSIDTMISVKHTLKVSSLLFRTMERFNIFTQQNCLQSNVFDFFTTIFGILGCSEVDEINKSIDEIISEEISFTKSQHEMRYQECFAVKPGKSGELDVARKAYLQSVEDIYEVCDTIHIYNIMIKQTNNCYQITDNYRKKFKLPIKVVYKSSRGYHLSIPSESVAVLPPTFIQAVQNYRNISCTTEDVVSLSDRAAEDIFSALTITHELLSDCMNITRSRMDVLFNISDSIVRILR